MPAESPSRIGTDPRAIIPKWNLDGLDKVVGKAYSARVVDVARGVLLEAWKALRGSFWLTSTDGEELFGFMLPYLCTFTFENSRERTIPRMEANKKQYLLHGGQTSSTVRKERQLWVMNEDEGDREKLWVAVVRIDGRLKAVVQELQALGGLELVVQCLKVLDSKGIDMARRVVPGNERLIDNLCGILKSFDFLSRTTVTLSENGSCARLEDIAGLLGVRLCGVDDFDVPFDKTLPALTSAPTSNPRKAAASYGSRPTLRRLKTQDDWEAKMMVAVDDRIQQEFDERLGYVLEERINQIVETKLSIAMEEKVDEIQKRHDATLKEQQVKTVMLLSEHKRKMEERFSALARQLDELKTRVSAVERKGTR